jgi:hypothetical protein
MKMARMVLSILLLVGLLLAHASASAQSAGDRATARALAYEGQAAFDGGDYAVAEDRFARADALVHAPTLLLALARSQVKLGKLVQAYENYQRIIREKVPAGSPDVFTTAYEAAQQEVEQIRARLGWVTIVVKGPEDPEVILDDKTPVPKAALGVKRAVNPGDHTLKASAPRFAAKKTDFHVGEGEAVAVTVTLSGKAATSQGSGIRDPRSGAAGAEADAQAGASSGKTIAYIALGIGAAGVITGTVTGLIAMSKHNELSDVCLNGRCPPEHQDTLDGFHLMGNVSTIGFILGGVGAAAGLTLLLTAPSDPEEPASGSNVSLRAGFGSILVRASF